MDITTIIAIGVALLFGLAQGLVFGALLGFFWRPLPAAPQEAPHPPVLPEPTVKTPPLPWRPVRSRVAGSKPRPLSPQEDLDAQK